MLKHYLVHECIIVYAGARSCCLLNCIIIVIIIIIICNVLLGHHNCILKTKQGSFSLAF